jgi:hypothetical protein
MNSSFRFIWLFVAFFLIIVFLSVLDSYKVNERKVDSERINSVLSDSIKLLIDTFNIDSYTERIDTTVKISGKVFCLDFRFGEIKFNDKLFYLIPETLRTLNAFDIEKIYLTKMVETEVGKYQNGILAIRRDVELYIIDIKKEEIILKKVFLGSDPPNEIKKRYGNKDNIFGVMPRDSLIVNFIISNIK